MKENIWLSSIPFLSSFKIASLLQVFSCAREIYTANDSLLLKCGALDNKDLEMLIAYRKIHSAEEQELLLIQNGISYVSIEEDAYPKRLRYISNPPYGLFYIGHLPKEEAKAVAMVGARGRSNYGSIYAEKIAEQLGILGVSVISGMARGIDADAHKGCLKVSGNTYAILGCGVDVCYPRQNEFIYRELMEHGGIISEYPLGVQPQNWHFPERNRIVAGMSDVVVVIEARKKSGSLITADFAMEQGKDVYALPGRISDSLSEGCHELIRQGAGIISNIEDFLFDLNLKEVRPIQMNFQKNLLEKEELLVYSLLDFCPVSLGKIIEETGLSLSKALITIKKLEEKGFIREISPNYYIQTL